jgi:NMD protein affecting ribosome stability and mRNA decay
MKTEGFERKCIVCGKKAEIEELCSSCYLSEHPIIKSFSEIKIIACPSCGKFLQIGRWIDSEPDAFIADVLSKKGKIDNRYCKSVFSGELELPEHSGAPGTSALGTISAHVSASPVNNRAVFSEEHSVPASVSYDLCEDCKLKDSKYFQATIQIRKSLSESADAETAYQKIVSAVRSEAKKIAQKGVYISKEEKSSNGIDILLTNNTSAINIARKVAAESGSELKINERLFSQTKSGVKLYRVTALINAPGFIPGSVVAIITKKNKEELFLVVEPGKTLQIESLMTGKKIAMPSYEIERCKTIEKKSAQVIRTKPNIEVLDPDTFQPVVPVNSMNRKLSLKAENSKNSKADIVSYEDAIYLA